jgi:hypothetical protein
MAQPPAVLVERRLDLFWIAFYFFLFLEDIAAAHADKKITGDEAYELAADAGHFPGAKPKFTKAEE